jgi:hypothetical protein
MYLCIYSDLFNTIGKITLGVKTDRRWRLQVYWGRAFSGFVR